MCHTLAHCCWLFKLEGFRDIQELLALQELLDKPKSTVKKTGLLTKILYQMPCDSYLYGVHSVSSLLVTCLICSSKPLEMVFRLV